MPLDIKLLDGDMGDRLTKYVRKANPDSMWVSTLIRSRPEDVIKAHRDFYRCI